MFRDSLLKEDPSLEVTLVDERLTTVLANKLLLESDISRRKRHAVIDKMAALQILESYLQRKEFDSMEGEEDDTDHQ